MHHPSLTCLTSSALISWASSVFYAGFLLAEFPAVYLLKRLPIGTFTSVNIIIWGVVLTMHAATTNYAGLITVRFLLGMCVASAHPQRRLFSPDLASYLRARPHSSFEAPITPAFMMLISMWYPRFEQGRRTSYFLAANGVGTLVCSPIAYGLSGITSSTIANWKVRTRPLPLRWSASTSADPQDPDPSMTP